MTFQVGDYVHVAREWCTLTQQGQRLLGLFQISSCVPIHLDAHLLY